MFGLISTLATWYVIGVIAVAVDDMELQSDPKLPKVPNEQKFLQMGELAGTLVNALSWPYKLCVVIHRLANKPRLGD